VLIQLSSQRTLEPPETISSKTNLVIGIRGVGYIFNINSGIKTHDTSGNCTSTIFGQIDGSKRTVRTASYCNYCFSTWTTAMWIEIILFCSILFLHFHKIWSIHNIPLTINWIGEDGTFVSPLS